MKISYRTHPALKFLEQGFINQFKVDEDEDISSIDEFMVQTFKRMCPEFNSIRALSASFAEAANKAGGKLFKEGVFDEIFNMPTNTGTLIISKSIVFYKITKNEIAIIIFDTAEYLNLFLYVTEDVNHFWASEKYISSFNKNEKEISAETLMQIVEQIIFAKFANVEIKNLNSGQKIKSIECNYKNDTRSNIKILNSNWFTTLVKSDGFNVRGHFRLQPKKKDGEWTKELIWITDFEKNGYTSPAKKLTTNA